MRNTRILCSLVFLGMACWSFTGAVGMADSVTPEDVDALVNAVEDLARTHGDAYEHGRDYLAQAKAMRNDLERGPIALDAFMQLQREALSANPLLKGPPLLFTVHVPDDTGTHVYMRPNGFSKKGSALKLLDVATGRTRVLVSASEGIIRRPCVHFDGKRVAFAMSKEPSDTFHIYEVEVDPKKPFEGGEVPVKQLTRAADVSDVDPIYLADGSIAFASSRDIKYVPCSKQLVPQLFRMDGDGANIHQLTLSTAIENETSLMPDGRILYSRWDYVDRNFGDGHGFWVANPDGSNPSIIWGNNTAHPSTGWSARVIPETGKLLCILGTHHGSLGGALAILDLSEAIEGRRSIARTWPPDVIGRFDHLEVLDLKGKGNSKNNATAATLTWPEAARALVPYDGNMRLYGWTDTQKDVRPWYNSPFPLNDKYFLCVRADKREAPPAIYLVDIFGNQLCLYEEAPGCFSPMPLVARSKPIEIPSNRDYGNGEGHFYIQNVHEGTHVRGVEPGEVKYVRVVEAVSKRGLSTGDWRGLGRQSPVLNWTDFNAKRILGTAPVESDGSASFLVPSDRFVYFQLLDEEGMMIQSMRSGTAIHSGETRGCVGCHESRLNAALSAPTDGCTLAMSRAPSSLEPWYGPERDFSYIVEVQPIFDKHCIKCHDFDGKGSKKLILAPDKDFAFNASYGELWHKGYVGAIGAGPAAHFPAKTWGSSVSPLIQHLRKGHNDIELDRRSMDRLITWIDLNGPYYPTTYAARPGPGPGRNPLSAEQASRLIELTGMDRESLETAWRYDGPKVSFDRPELSPCLKHLDKDSTEYAESLSLIQAGKESLKNTPRADMQGFTPFVVDRRRQAHHEKYSRIEQEVREAIRAGVKVMDSAEATDETRGL